MHLGGFGCLSGDSILYPGDVVMSWRTRLCTAETRLSLGLGLGWLPRDPGYAPGEFGYVTEVPAFVPIALWDPELLPAPARFWVAASPHSCDSRTPGFSEWARLVLQTLPAHCLAPQARAGVPL